MPLRYLLHEININKKFARKQEVSWAETKTHIFNILSQVSVNNLFNISDKGNPKYNLVEDYGSDNSSLSICPIESTNTEKILSMSLLSTDEQEVTLQELTQENYQHNSFIALFHMGMIKHQDIVLFENGRENNIWNYVQGDNARILSKTSFGIIVSDKLQKIIVVKKSDTEDSNIGLTALQYYFASKSHTFRTLLSDHTVKFNPFIKDRDFNVEDIASLYSLDIAINADLVREYKQRTGRNDLFSNLLINALPRFFSNGRTLSFSISFSEEGDEDAKQLFRDIYSSFAIVQGEDIEKMFNTFKIVYEKTTGEKMPINFKRDKLYRYEPQNSRGEFEYIYDAFKWLCAELSSTTEGE